MGADHQVIWSDGAADDLANIIRYIHRENPAAARDTLSRIRARAYKIGKLPLQGRLVPELHAQGIDNYREIIVAPWRIIYRISQEQLFVVAVFDSRRNLEDVLLDKLT